MNQNKLFEALNLLLTRVIQSIFFFKCYVGYDTLPLDSMHGLETNSHGGGSNYGTSMDILSNNPLDEFSHLNELPRPPSDNNQVAAWYDTDL